MDKQLKKQLKAQAHHLQPVVILGAHGLTDAVQREIDVALTAHELIKIRINALDKKEREAISAAICTEQNADLVGMIGHIGIFYRECEDQ